jgi:hypothetical protein
MSTMSIPKQSTVQATQSSAPLAEDPKIIQFMRTEEEIESWALSSYNKQTTERTALGWDRVIWIGHWEDKDSGDCCSCRQPREGSTGRYHWISQPTWFHPAACAESGSFVSESTTENSGSRYWRSQRDFADVEKVEVDRRFRSRSPRPLLVVREEGGG